MSDWIACWQRDGAYTWRLTITDEDGETWLDRTVGMADPKAGPPTGLILPGTGWRLLDGTGWQQDAHGSQAAPVCPVSAEAEASMREELGLA